MIGELLVVLVIALIVFGPVLLRSRRRDSGAGDDRRVPSAAWHAGPTWRPSPLTTKQVALAVGVGGVLANALDIAVHGYLLGTEYYSRLPGVFRDDGSPVALVLGDFVAVGVFLWVYDRVWTSFRPGALGGATFGLYAGVLIGFPTHIFVNLAIVDFPYPVAWAWTANQVVWGGLVGGAVGAILGNRN